MRLAVRRVLVKMAFEMIVAGRIDLETVKVEKRDVVKLVVVKGGVGKSPDPK